VEILEQVALAERTTMRVGGAARYFARAESDDGAIEALRWADHHGVPVHVLGGGSNVVVSDAGVDGLVLEVAQRGIAIKDEADGAVLTAAAGEPWDALVARSVTESLAGLECLSGIPGRVGATPIQNVGAYGQEVAETISRVRCFDRKTDSVVEIPAAQCGFRYRDSRFKSEEPGRFLVLGVSYRLTRGGAPKVRYPELARRLGEAPTLAEARKGVLAVRREKSMVLSAEDDNVRSCGSFFVNPVVDAARVAEIEAAAASGEMPRYPQPDGRVKLPAAWLIERAGFAKGTRDGNVGLSTKHTLAVVAHGAARAGDVVAFARAVRRTVEQRFGVRLVPEPSFWGFASLDFGLPDERMA
jgi:UDP-N-acetylmuramate dehydrogenase